jgi:ubiquinone/menaquinone biosynthesis C-methylase UbiE
MTAHDRVFKASEAHKLEDPERLVWLPPQEVLGALPLDAGATVADIGAGTGYFALPMARRVERVFAVDMQPEMLELLRAKLASPDAPRNVSLVQGAADRTTLAGASCNVALLANVWHELDDHAAVLRESARILKPRGTLAILDWRPDVDRPTGPPLEHRIAAEQVRSAAAAAGWIAAPPKNIGRYSYLVLLTAK